ncbi:unnamed protein product, partial [Pleuronectes platessa]
MAPCYNWRGDGGRGGGVQSAPTHSSGSQLQGHAGLKESEGALRLLLGLQMRTSELLLLLLLRGGGRCCCVT